MQELTADRNHELRDLKRSSEERASEIRSNAKRDIDALKAELAASQTSHEAALKVALQEHLSCTCAVAPLQSEA